MIPRIPHASYRLQLREGVGFAEIERQLDHVAGLGISHLYLSPIFSAVAGSSHGYDVIDPTTIDAALGGREGFERLARAAIARDMGIILDIVPNHTAFSLQNPWLADVLRHGKASRYAAHFDIDWRAGPLVLPFLPEPFEKMCADGRFTIGEGSWRFDDLAIPLAPGTPDGGDPHAVHQAQHWRLRHWEIERDGLTHRRFFNITGLIGMRVEDRAVFDDTHRLVIDLVRARLVHGLRIDHIDGLADPAAYLATLARALPGTPLWVEKILMGEETLPENWACEGTTGYEAARFLARGLTDAKGLERLDALWRRATGTEGDFARQLAHAKRAVIENELAAELHQLIGLADRAAKGSPFAEPGPETLREAIIAMLSALPRYRTYFAAGRDRETDRALLAGIIARAAASVRSDRTLHLLATMLAAPRSDAQRAFRTRFQQVSGALLAKAQEDTAGFRWSRFIAANEVGAEPDAATLTEAEANRFLAARRTGEMTLTSSHDTKRSEDARMRLVAISHCPEAFAALFETAGTLAQASAVDPSWRWYIVQSALAIWGGEPDLVKRRLGQHIPKAYREAKQTSFWTRPDSKTEEAAIAFAHALCDQWARTPPEALATLVARGAALSLAQLAFKMLMPGFPDIYRGAEAPFFALTDPDNRAPFDWRALARAGAQAEAKTALTRRLLALRKAEPAFFLVARSHWCAGSDGIALSRTDGQRRLLAQLWPDAPTGEDPGRTIWDAPLVGRERLRIVWQSTP